jgi:regulator of replication initiation timing
MTDQVDHLKQQILEKERQISILHQKIAAETSRNGALNMEIQSVSTELIEAMRIRKQADEKYNRQRILKLPRIKDRLTDVQSRTRQAWTRLRALAESDEEEAGATETAGSRPQAFVEITAGICCFLFFCFA